MKWYVLQVMTGSERDVCTALRRKGVQARAPAQRMEIRRRGQWQTEDRLLLPGYVFVGADYNAALFHLVSPVPGVIRWLGLEHGEPQALDTREALRWRLDSENAGAQPGAVSRRRHVARSGRPSGGVCRLPGADGAAAAPGVCDGGAGRRGPAGAVRRHPCGR
ncbi:MAG: transcription termination/antitermination NusG family protein [Ruthenibacterium lactatiformans]